MRTARAARPPARRGGGPPAGGGGSGHRRHQRTAPAASSRGTASGPRPPRRSRPSRPTKARRLQWFRWPGRVAQLPQIGAAGHVEHAPQRLVGDGDEQVAAGDPGHLGQHALGVGHVLEHLGRGDEIELVVGERRAARRAWPELEVGAPPLRAHSASSLGPARSTPTTAAAARRCGPLLAEDALAAAHVEHRGRRRLGEQLVQRALEAGHQPPDDRIARSRTCRTCCRSGRPRRGAGAHTPSASALRYGVAVAGLRAAGPRRARSARARRRAGARSAGRARRCAATASAGRRAGRR